MRRASEVCKSSSRPSRERAGSPGAPSVVGQKDKELDREREQDEEDGQEMSPIHLECALAVVAVVCVRPDDGNRLLSGAARRQAGRNQQMRATLARPARNSDHHRQQRSLNGLAGRRS